MKIVVIAIMFAILSISGALLTVSAVRTMQAAQAEADKSFAEALQ